MRRTFAIVAFLLLSISAQAQCTSPCVQTAFDFNAGAGATHDIVITGSQSAGNMNMVTLRFCADNSCTTVVSLMTCSATDDNGNSYTTITANYFSGEIDVCTMYAPNINSSAGSVTVHVTASASSGTYFYVGGSVTEYHGVTTTPLDQSGSSFDAVGSTAMSIGPTSTLSQANELVIVSAYSRFNNRTVASPYTWVDGTQEIEAFTVVSSTAGVSASMTASSSDTWGMNIATFKCVTDCSSSPPPPAAGNGLLQRMVPHD